MANPDPAWTAEHIRQLAPDDRSIPAAREVLRKGGFGNVEPTADGRGWWVVCQGLTDVYQVSVRRGEEGNFDCECTCPSPKYPCKHALALLLYLAEHPEERVEKAEVARAADDFEALLRATFRHPDDDTPRLVFADYLEENGQADRAQLIRVQCELARGGSRAARRKELTAEESRLLQTITPLVTPLPEPFGIEGFRRGFLRLTSISFDTEQGAAFPARFIELIRNGWVESIAVVAVASLNPVAFDLFRLVGELDFTMSYLNESGLVGLAVEVGSSRPDSRVARVRLRPAEEKLYAALLAGQADPAVNLPRGRRESHRYYQNLTAAQLGLLIRAGRLEGVRNLALDGPISDDGAALLADVAGAAGVTELTLSATAIGARGAAALAGSPHLAGLTRLRLIGRAITQEGFAELCQRAAFPRLAELTVTGGPLGDAAAEAIGRTRHFTRLESLTWVRGSLSVAGVASILGSAGLTGLERVDVSDNEGVPTNAAVVLEAVERPELEVRFSGEILTRTVTRWGTRLVVALDAGYVTHPFIGLGTPPAARGLSGFVCNGLDLTPAVVEELAVALSPDQLKELNLSRTRLGNAGAAAVATAFREFRPETLNLSHDNVRRSGAEALAASPLLASLKVLDLSHNNLGFPAVRAIVKSPHLGKLKEMRLQATGLSIDEWKQVEQAVGKGVVV
jgi:uncharacterized protein (TIGR02996 family)